MRSVQAKTGATGASPRRRTSLKQAREMRSRTTVHSATEAARGQAFSWRKLALTANEVLALADPRNTSTLLRLANSAWQRLPISPQPCDATGFNLNVSESGSRGGWSSRSRLSPRIRT